MFIQEWSVVIRDIEKYEIYRSFFFEKEKFISSIDIIYCFRVAVALIDLEYFH